MQQNHPWQHIIAVSHKQLVTAVEYFSMLTLLNSSSTLQVALQSITKLNMTYSINFYKFVFAFLDNNAFPQLYNTMLTYLKTLSHTMVMEA